MELTITAIFYLLLFFNCIFSAFLILSFDGFLLHLKGVRLFNEEFDELENKYDILSYHSFEFFRIITVILIIAAVLIYFKGGI